jgi:hypothetical protein
MWEGKLDIKKKISKMGIFNLDVIINLIYFALAIIVPILFSIIFPKFCVD